MAVTVTSPVTGATAPIFNADNTQNCCIVYGTLTLSGSYVAHGDSINFALLDVVKTQNTPVMIQIWEQPAAGTSPSGYFLQAFPVSTANTPAGRFCVYTSNG